SVTTSGRAGRGSACACPRRPATRRWKSGCRARTAPRPPAEGRARLARGRADARSWRPAPARAPMHTACLSLGSNVDPERHVALAFAALRERFGAIRASAAYRTPAVCFSGADFVNDAAVIRTGLGVHALNAWLQAL